MVAATVGSVVVERAAATVGSVVVEMAAATVGSVVVEMAAATVAVGPRAERGLVAMVEESVWVG